MAPNKYYIVRERFGSVLVLPTRLFKINKLKQTTTKYLTGFCAKDDSLSIGSRADIDSLGVDKSIVATAVSSLQVELFGGEELVYPSLLVQEARVVADDLPAQIRRHFT